MRHLASEQWGTIGFSLHPSVHIVSLHGNAIAIWLALDKKQTPPAVVSSASASNWLIWRKQLQPQFRSMNHYETCALQELQQGHSFSMVCETAVAKMGEHDFTVQGAGWLQTWLNEEILMGYTL